MAIMEHIANQIEKQNNQRRKKPGIGKGKDRDLVMSSLSWD